MKNETAAALAGLTLVTGVLSGYAAAGEPETRTPSACHLMAHEAIEAFKLWAAITDATQERGDALDVRSQAIADAEVNHLLASLEVVAPKYDAAATKCVGTR